MGQLPSWITAAIAGSFISFVVSVFAAITAFRALRLSRKTAQSQLRPYVYPSYIGLIFTDELDVEGLPKEWATVAVHIKNFGITPAIGARATMTREIWEYPIPKKHKGFALQAFAPDYQDMPPRCTSENRLDFEIPEKQTDMIVEKKVAVYVMGRIEYSDNLGGSHYTNFFQFCTGDDFYTGTFRNCGTNNDAT